MRAVYICSKTEHEGSIYAARQGMRACNNNNMRNPSYISFIMGLRMLLLLHALIPCLAYILPSSPVLLHMYTVVVSLLFGTVIPTFYILMEMFLVLLYHIEQLFILVFSAFGQQNLYRTFPG